MAQSRRGCPLRRRRGHHLSLGLALVVFLPATSLAQVTTERVSLAGDGTQANDGSVEPSVSADGRYIAFDSWASNLISGDTNGKPDIFVRDRWTGSVTRVSVSSGGVQSNGYSNYPKISADGRFVSFQCTATNLVSNDTNGRDDAFVHDRQTGQTTRVSISSSGAQGNGDSVAPTISADGRYVAFTSTATNLVDGDTNGDDDIFRHDRQTGETTRMSVGAAGVQSNASSELPSISADGQCVAFYSFATNLVTGDTNNVSDVFIRTATTTLRLSVSNSGAQADADSDSPSISADGTYVAFSSSATNLVAGDTNGLYDVFVRDRISSKTTRMSVSSAGAEANGGSSLYTPAALSADGRFVAFRSAASNLVSDDTNGIPDLFLHDREAGQTTRVNLSSSGAEANDLTTEASVSADGRHVVFYSYATNLVEGDTNGEIDVFVRDCPTTDTTQRVSLSSSEVQGTYESWSPSVDGEGRLVVFDSQSNLVSGDTNNVRDVFLHDRYTGQTTRVSLTSSSGQATGGGSQAGWISANGLLVTFESRATNLVSGDTNAYSDIFVKDLQTRQVTRVSVDSSGAQANSWSVDPTISADGRIVAFESGASNLVVGDNNGLRDVFAHDRQTGQTKRVSVDSSGVEANGESNRGSVSANGRYVAFYSLASNLVPGDTSGGWDVFVHDLQTAVTERVSLGPGGVQANNPSYRSSISADGRFVAFTSIASNLVSGDTNGAYDIFVRDRQTGQTTRVNVDSAGAQANGNSDEPSISADGRYVMFYSYASNLVEGDTNAVSDVFIHDRQSGETRRLSTDSAGTEGNNNSRFLTSISGNGRVASFESTASNLVPGDANAVQDIFVAAPQSLPAKMPLPANQWRQIGLPLLPWASPNGQVASLFGDDLTGGYGSTWRVYDWDEDTQGYVWVPETSNLIQGQGYWVKRTDSEAGDHIDMTGSLRPLIPAKYVDLQVRGDLDGEWNMLGTPWEFRTDWGDARVVYGAPETEHTLVQAESDGKMSRIMYEWSGAAYQSYDGQTPGAEGALDCWDGFWVQAFDNVKLRVYGTATGGDTGGEARQPRGWYVRLIVEAGALRDPGNLLGQLDGASSAWDEHDLAELEPFDEQAFLTLVFPHPDWGHRAGDYTTDFRPMPGQGAQRKVIDWPIEVRSPLPQQVTLSWELGGDAIGVLKRSVLIDIEKGQRILPALTGSYSFSIENGSHRLLWRLHNRPEPGEPQ